RRGLENRPGHAARPAPLGPEVEHHERVVLDGRLDVFLGDLAGRHGDSSIWGSTLTVGRPAWGHESSWGRFGGPGASMPDRVVLIDGSNLVFRAFFAVPSNLTTATGLHPNEVTGIA